MSTKSKMLEKYRVFYGHVVILAMAAAFWTNNAEAQILPVGRCCLPNGGGCIVTDEVTCDNHCGSFGGAGTDCSGPVFCLIQNPPPPPPPPPILGACCLPDGSCTEISECNCDGQGGVYKGNNSNCGALTCDPDSGACCLPDGSCIITTDCDCEHQCGLFSGPGSLCTLCPITPSGACCLPNGTCSVMSECECDNACGFYKGDGSICTGLCIVPFPGACCFPDGTCSVVSKCECAAECGAYNGNGTNCSGPVLCVAPNPGACCLPDGESCTIVDTVCDCDDLCGSYQGDGSRCAACPSCATPDLGCWSDPVDLNDGSDPSWPHAAQLINGKVLLISHTNPTKCHLFDPSDDSFSVQFPVSTGHRLFCTGHTYTDNGRIVFYGGTGAFRQLTSIYTPDSMLGSWAVGDTGPAKRFYPTLTTLSDGIRVLVTDGADNDDPPTTNPRIPDIYDPNALPGFQWTRLTGAEYNNPTYPFDLPNYPSMYLATNGFVIYTGSANGGGPNPLSQTSKFPDPLLERWIERFTPPDPIHGGSHISYGLNHFMKAGGRQFSTPVDLVYDLVDPTGSSPQWVPRGSMNNSRREFLLVGLPGAEGSILAVGGEDASLSPVKKPELYDAAANAWTELKEATHPREYHASALLLPDARVLSAGGQAIMDDNRGKTTVEIFSPPYLFESTGHLASRPTISSVTGPGGSDIINFDNTFVTTTSSASSVTAINLISPAVVTHALDHHQIVRSLDFVLVDSTTLKVLAPVHEYEAAPGYYMLFITADGVPSKAAWVHLERL